MWFINKRKQKFEEIFFFSSFPDHILGHDFATRALVAFRSVVLQRPRTSAADAQDRIRTRWSSTHLGEDNSVDVIFTGMESYRNLGRAAHIRTESSWPWRFCTSGGMLVACRNPLAIQLASSITFANTLWWSSLHSIRSKELGKWQKCGKQIPLKWHWQLSIWQSHERGEWNYSTWRQAKWRGRALNLGHEAKGSATRRSRQPEKTGIGIISWHFIHWFLCICQTACHLQKCTEISILHWDLWIGNPSYELLLSWQNRFRSWTERINSVQVDVLRRTARDQSRGNREWT